MAHIKIAIYTTSRCPWCKKAKRYFKELGIPFKEYNVEKDQKAAERMVRKTGQMGVPVIEIGNQTIVGFDKTKIERLLGIK